MNSNVAYADFGNQRRQERSTVANLEDGYTRIANDLFEAVMCADLTARQLKVVMAIIRKTYGFGKKLDRITNTQIAEMTGIHHTHVCKAKNEMIAMNIVISSGNKIGINKDFTEWNFNISQVSETLAKSANKTLAKTANSHKPSQLNTKETITKEKKEKIPLTPVGEDIALEILDYFNQLTNSKFQSTEPILKALNTIKARGECYTADEIKLVMEWAVKTWTKGKDLKPQNLCRMTRFDGYLSDAIKWKNRDGINPVDCPHEELIKIWNKYVPERAIDFHEWTSRRPAYKDLEAVWNGKTNKGQWREVKHMDTCFKLISQSSLLTGLQDKGWLTLDWILTPTRWSQTYEQAKREYTERKKGIV
ncbi:TPA: replication protein [Proteus mirabilis]|nr:replication protein [Proteus mirabilis]DAH60148.1 MAG TPA: replication protein O [Caudoviricetes sp.]HEK1835662.1 replication protein [Proteus mirabilis]